MNNYEITILQYKNRKDANVGVNDFIEDCEFAGVRILDMESHYSEGDSHVSFVFVFKTEGK